MADGGIRFGGAHAELIPEIGTILDAGVVGVDRDLVITAWNPWLEAATGKRAQDVIGRSITDVEPNMRPSSLNAIKRAVGGATVVLSQQLHGYLLEIKPPAGHESFARMQQSVRILPLFGDDGDIRGAVALIQDVTERVARERELSVAVEAAQSANRAKSDFLAAMSHELRTPIGAAAGYADLLAEGIYGPISDEQKKQLLRIKTVSKHLLAIVDEILLFARMEAGRELVRLAPADGVEIVEQALVAVEPLVEKKGLSIARQVSDATCAMVTDEVKVRQILINLLGNATKFTDTGGITITVDAAADAARVLFRITDTGAGIASDDLERIFEPFVQAESGHSRGRGGTGLGLSVSRELARVLGGDITVESQRGKGSTFTLALPRESAAAPPAAGASVHI